MNKTANVLWIVLDGLRADRVGCYGHDRAATPNLDALARDGLMAEIAIAQSGWSLPSYATMLTGLYPSEHGLMCTCDTLRDDVPTLPAVLSSAGFQTLAIVANPYLADPWGLNRGFDMSFVHLQRRGQIRQHGRDRWAWWHLGRRLMWYLGLWEKGGYPVTRYFLSLLDSLSQPWFAFLALIETHAPYKPPLKYLRRHITSTRELLTHPLFAKKASKVHGRRMMLGTPAMDRLLRLYDAEIEYSDWLVGLLLTELQRRQILDSTIVIVTADHGDLFGEHGGLLDHSIGLSNGLVRVPLLIRWPESIAPGTRIREPVELRDLPHSICKVFGVDGLAPTCRPTVHILGGEEGDGHARPAYAERKTEPQGTRLHDVVKDIGKVLGQPPRDVQLLRSRHWEFLAFEDGTRELFRVDDDPMETRNLADQHPDMVARFEDELGRIHAAAHQAAPAAGQEQSIPEDVARRLQDLGYL